MSTIIVGAILFILFVLAAAHIIRSRKQGGGASCGSCKGCSGCDLSYEEIKK